MRWSSPPSIGGTVTITIVTGITAGMATTGTTVGIAITIITAATGIAGSR